MKRTRILALSLAALMLVGTLAACGTPDPPSETQDPSQTVAESTNETVLQDELPDNLNYGGDEIVFISGDQLVAEELTGEPVSDAIFERNTAVEQRLGIKIKYIQDDNPIDKVVNAVSGGSDDYDIMVELCWRSAPKFMDGYFADLRQTEYLDFEKPWWNQSFNDVVSYNDAQYGVTGAMVLSLYRRTYVTVFNKKLFTDANQPFLYDYVKNGTWTLDKQISLVPIFHQDNGNAQKDESGDIYGFISNDFIYVDPYWASCEVDIIKKNADGDYEWVFEPAKLHDMAEKVLTLYYDDGTYDVTDDVLAEPIVLDMFSSGYGAMATLCIELLEDPAMRNMPHEYGVVPIPKYSESQSTYHSQMHDAFTVASIPTTVRGDRLNELSAVLEALSSTSYRVVRPVYYETTLRTKLAQDPESAEMMDLIINNIHIDAGFVYSHAMGSFHQGFQQLVGSGQNDAISRYKKLARSAQNNLNSIVQKLDKLAQQG